MQGAERAENGGVQGICRASMVRLAAWIIADYRGLLAFQALL
jgi:hypothetical protein